LIPIPCSIIIGVAAAAQDRHTHMGYIFFRLLGQKGNAREQ
jgi:hypothetical protein